MKKTKKFLLAAFITFIFNFNNTLPIVSANIPYFTYSYEGVYNLNDNISENDKIYIDNKGRTRGLNDYVYYQTVDYMVDSSKNITNADLGLSDEYSLKKIKAKGCNIFRIEVKDETEMNNLFEQTKTLCDNKKIQNVYTLEYCSFPYAHYEEGDYIIIDVPNYAFLRNYYIYNEQMVDDSIILGDSNEDFDLDVRDCSFIAKNLASRETDKINEKADFNADNDIDVRDAAALAKHLAEK